MGTGSLCEFKKLWSRGLEVNELEENTGYWDIGLLDVMILWSRRAVFSKKYVNIWELEVCLFMESSRFILQLIALITSPQNLPPSLIPSTLLNSICTVAQVCHNPELVFCREVQKTMALESGCLGSPPLLGQWWSPRFAGTGVTRQQGAGLSTFVPDCYLEGF